MVRIGIRIKIEQMEVEKTENLLTRACLRSHVLRGILLEAFMKYHVQKEIAVTDHWIRSWSIQVGPRVNWVDSLPVGSSRNAGCGSDQLTRSTCHRFKGAALLQTTFDA